MDSAFDNVKDSSIWHNPTHFRAAHGTDANLYMGIVRSAFNDENTGELRYIVEVHKRSDVVLTNCRMLRNLGGAFNYEDAVLHGYDSSGSSANGTIAKAGDIVLVGQFAGQGREGVILGGLMHPARKVSLDASKGPQYRSEFNGVETYINDDGEYTLTFKGKPTNASELERAPDRPIPAPQYDTKVGSSFLKFDKNGSFIVSDNSENAQYLKIDKSAGTVNLVAGKVSLEMFKNDEATRLVTKTLEVQATEVTVGDSGTQITLSAGSKGAARVGDKCTFHLIAGPYTVTGTIFIGEGSTKVMVG